MPDTTTTTSSTAPATSGTADKTTTATIATSSSVSTIPKGTVYCPNEGCRAVITTSVTLCAACNKSTGF